MGMRETAARIIDSAAAYDQPYAVFGGRSVEWMPANGKRFAKVQRNPVRMAQFAGIFDCGARPQEIVEALQAVSACN